MTAPTETTTTAVVTTQPKGAMVKLLEPRAEVLAKLLPKGLDVNRVIAAAQLAAYQNPDLLKADPASIFLAVGKVAQWGLEIGTTAYLVCYGTQVSAQKDYKGVIELIIRSKSAKTVRVGTIREGDYYEHEEGDTPFLKHRPLLGNRAPALAFYAIASHGKDIPPTIKVMGVEEVDEIRQKHSKQWKKGPLPDWYGLKTVVHRLGKYLVQNSEHAAMLDDDDDLEIPAGEFSLTAAEREAASGFLPKAALPRAPEGETGYGAAAEGVDFTTGEVLE